MSCSFFCAQSRAISGSAATIRLTLLGATPLIRAAAAYDPSAT
nr:MAG TPA: hypothetical protein [Bacteriophage sp.]